MPETVQILKIVSQEEKNLIFLSPNSLYQGGGGQPPDKALLIQGEKTASLSAVGETSEGVGWIVPEKHEFTIGEALIEKDRLFHWEVSQQHTAQHVFSGWAESLYGWKSDGFALQDKISKIELLGASDDPLPYEELEKRTHLTILTDIPVLFSETTQDDSLRKPVHYHRVRIVEIPGVDKCGCGGTHVHSTGQIGAFSILHRERKNKQAVRIWFAAGLRLGSLAKAYYEWEQQLRKWLSGDVEERIRALLSKIDQHDKIEKWFWKELTDLLPSEQKTIELQGLPLPLTAMKTLASLFFRKGVSSFLVNEDQYFVLCGDEAEKRLDDLKRQGASGGGKGMITGQLH
jgi:alanyl-tRNA synthetase